MKKMLCLCLCFVMLGSLAACGQNTNEKDISEETKVVDNFSYPEIKNPLTWESINAIPVKSENMSVQEMREICVAFMRLSKTAMYTPNAILQFEKNTSGATDEMHQGIIYGGMPYIGRGGCGNVYRMMDYIDEKGVLDMEKILQNPALFGSHCSSSTYWAWGRVINSVGHAFTARLTHANGYLRVGPYTYPETTEEFSDKYTTTMICTENGMDTMFASYAQLQLADGLVQYVPGGGHVIMASSEPTVVYDGSAIDPYQSYVTILEQAQNWKEYTNEAGDVAQVKTSVDKKMTFLELYEKHYLPFTYAEFLGTKPVEKTECAINLSGESVSAEQVFGAKVTANFGISDIYVNLTNSAGKNVYRLVVRAAEAGAMQLDISQTGNNVFQWGNYDNLKGTYTVEVSAQLSTGERPVLYSGKMTVKK